MNLGNESETIEFKKSTGEHKEAMQTIAAMLNKHGHGELYFGVKDSGEVVGQNAADTTVRQIASWVSDKIEPSIAPTIECLTDGNGKAFIRVGFSGAEAPYSAEGRYFIRVGTSNKTMAASELTKMIIERERERNPWDTMSSGKNISDVNERAVREFYRLAADAGRITINFTNTSDFLDRLGMIAADGTLTNAADVLFCDAGFGTTRISLARLAGNNRVDIIDLRHEKGPLLTMLKEATNYVLGGISRKFIIPKDGTVVRQEIPEIPANAIREAIANALIHRDYNDSAAVEVCVYRDTVEISNPGIFPEGDSPDLHIEGKATHHGLRNTKLAEAVYRTGTIEQFGTGIPRISEECDRAGVTFRYEQDQGFTTIVFDRPGSQITYVNEDGNPVSPPEGAWGSKKENNRVAPSRPLSTREEIALDIAQKQGKVTTKTLVEATEVGRAAARSTLQKLADEGLLERIGESPSDPRQYYQLANRY